MRQRMRRRQVLATAAVSLGLSGCIQSTAKQSWDSQDEYPDDESRNRKCEIRSSGATAGKIEPSPNSLGYLPFAYTLSGREDMHGTNQHYDLTITADDDIKVVGLTIDNAVNSVIQSDSSTLELPDDSKIVDQQTVAEGDAYQGTWKVPDGETYTILTAPDGDITRAIDVSIDLGCSYYLPFDEYKERIE